MNPRRLSYSCVLLLLIVSCGEGPTATDTALPWTIGDLSVRATREGFHLRWTATGDDGNQGRAAHYDVRYASSNLRGTWASAHVVSPVPQPSAPGYPDSCTITGVAGGPWEFGVKIGDDSGNWSFLSNVVSASIDTLPPAAITDLEVRSTHQGFYLSWTAPGNDGHQGQASRYDIRYASSDLAGAWGSAHVVASPPAPAPGGHADSASVMGIGMGPWEFAVRTADASGNWSALSNIVVTTIPEDDIPPASVTDLAVDMVTEGSTVLRWTASGDDGTSGQAGAYDIRYASAPITPETWAGATKVPGPTPRSSGESEIFAVLGLHSGSPYYFALRVLDEAENWSELSNSVSASVSVPMQLTSDFDEPASDPDWSPDGHHIAYSGQWYTQPYPIPVIYVIPAMGGTPVRYTSDYSTQPAWSPDGSKFAFSLYVDEQVRTVLALMAAVPEAPSQVLIDPSVKSTGSARWSPDGARIAYVATTRFIGEPSTSNLYTIASSGGTPEHLYGGAWGISGIDWSPDGTRIVCSSNESGSNHLWVMPSQGGNATQLITAVGTETSPAWSPDGRSIAFIGNDQVWLLYLAEGYSIQVTFDPAKKIVREMDWSPDGTRIAFGASRGGPGPDSVWNIWVLAIH